MDSENTYFYLLPVSINKKVKGEHFISTGVKQKMYLI